MIQRSLVLMKPDAVKRGIVGEILHRFERVGLKVVATKLVHATKELSKKHYNKDDAWKLKVGKIRLVDCEKHGLDAEEIYGTSDPVKIGGIVNDSNHDYLSSGPVMAIVFEGVNCVDTIKKLVGPTYSIDAPAGTIRGDFGTESPYTSLIRKRTIFNMIHASGTPEEAEYEISLWFKDDEVLKYRRVHEDLYSY